MSIEKKTYSSLHLVAKFNQEIDIKKESEIIQSLSKINIVVHSLSGCYIGNERNQGLIFGYSSVRPTIIRQKVIQMTDILNECLALSMCDKIYVSNSNIPFIITLINPEIKMELY